MFWVGVLYQNLGYIKNGGKYEQSSVSNRLEVTETRKKQFVSFLLMGVWNFSEVPIAENVN
jgi:hypothetical protein